MSKVQRSYEQVQTNIGYEETTARAFVDLSTQIQCEQQDNSEPSRRQYIPTPDRASRKVSTYWQVATGQPETHRTLDKPEQGNVLARSKRPTSTCATGMHRNARVKCSTHTRYTPRQPRAGAGKDPETANETQSKPPPKRDLFKTTSSQSLRGLQMRRVSPSYEPGAR